MFLVWDCYKQGWPEHFHTSPGAWRQTLWTCLGVELLDPFAYLKEENKAKQTGVQKIGVGVSDSVNTPALGWKPGGWLFWTMYPGAVDELQEVTEELVILCFLTVSWDERAKVQCPSKVEALTLGWDWKAAPGNRVTGCTMAGQLAGPESVRPSSHPQQLLEGDKLSLRRKKTASRPWSSS